MEFIAHYWWIWFSGLAVVLITVAIRVVLGMIGLAKDAVEVVGEIRRTAALPAENRKQHVVQVSTGMAVDKIKQHFVKKITTGMLIFLGCVFGLLLLISLAHFVTSKTAPAATVHSATVAQC